MGFIRPSGELAPAEERRGGERTVDTYQPVLQPLCLVAALLLSAGCLRGARWSLNKQPLCDIVYTV